MKTKKNYKGECYEVTFEKEFKTQSGFTFLLKREEDIERKMMETSQSTLTK